MYSASTGGREGIHRPDQPVEVSLMPAFLAVVDHDELPHPIVAYLPRTILDRFGREKHPVPDRAGSFKAGSLRDRPRLALPGRLGPGDRSELYDLCRSRVSLPGAGLGDRSQPCSTLGAEIHSQRGACRFSHGSVLDTVGSDVAFHPGPRQWHARPGSADSTASLP